MFNNPEITTTITILSISHARKTATSKNYDKLFLSPAVVSCAQKQYIHILREYRRLRKANANERRKNDLCATPATAAATKIGNLCSCVIYIYIGRSKCAKRGETPLNIGKYLIARGRYILISHVLPPTRWLRKYT